MSFGAYMLAKEKKERMYAEYNSASRGLELSQIKERLAEIRSQHEPLDELINKKLSERDRLCHAAHYVVVGRFPEEDSQ